MNERESDRVIEKRRGKRSRKRHRLGEGSLEFDIFICWLLCNSFV